MRHSFVHRCAGVAVSVYMEHLHDPEKKLQSLHDAFRNLRSNPSGVVEFHKKLCDAMAAEGKQFVGIKVVPPTHELGTAFRATRSICMPLFTSFLAPTKRTFNVAKDRIEFVEPGLTVRLAQSLPADATTDNLSSSGATVAATIELTGTRFPFFAPSFNDFAADLGGCVGVVVGRENLIKSFRADTLNSYGVVLTRDEEPIQVGSGQLCDGGAVKCVNTALQYAQRIGRPLGPDSLVLCVGVAPRSPALPGKYMLNWGAYGTANCILS